MSTEIKVFDLISHYSEQKVLETSINGLMIPVWNSVFDFEKLRATTYVYLTTVFPRKVKGPYCHTQRNSILTCVNGQITLVVKEETGFREVVLQPYQTVSLPALTEFALVGTSQTETVLLNLCDFPWVPETKEAFVPDFSQFNFKKLTEK